MVKLFEPNCIPQCNRALIRQIRAREKVYLSDCVLNTDLGEEWRRIERGDVDAVSRETLICMADFLNCEPDELLTEACLVSQLPETIELIDTEDWIFSSDPASGLRAKLVTDGDEDCWLINFEDATDEDVRSFFDMLDQRCHSLAE